MLKEMEQPPSSPALTGYILLLYASEELMCSLKEVAALKCSVKEISVVEL